MEELAPHNAYHAKWAVEALLSASRGGVALEGYAGYARKVLEGHCGPGALEVALGAKAILQGMEDATRMQLGHVPLEKLRSPVEWGKKLSCDLGLASSEMDTLEFFLVCGWGSWMQPRHATICNELLVHRLA